MGLPPNPPYKGYRVYTSRLDFVYSGLTPPTPPYKGGAFAPSPLQGEGWGGVSGLRIKTL